MKVDHICVNYGAELFQELFMELHNKKIVQSVFYPRNSKHRKANPEVAFRIDSPMVLSLRTRVSFSWKRRIMRQGYDPLFHRNKPDILHAHTLFSDGSLANYYYEKYDTPFVVAIRSSDLDVFLKFKPWLKRYGLQILENARYIVFISPSLKRKFLREFGSRFESKSMIIPNGISQSYLESVPPKMRGLHTPLEVLYVGSFLKRKNVPALIKLSDKTGVKLSLVGGGGTEEKKVRHLSAKSDKITYLGRIEDPSKLLELYRQSDIFVMVSKRETFGLVYIEAMSQGLPVIYSKNTGIDGLFEQGSVGYGVNPGSVPEMIEGVDRIVADYEEISHTCVSEARQFNWSSIAERYLRIYKKIVS